MSNKNTSDTPQWYVIHTKPKQEGRADSNLRSWQVETFAPKLRESCSNQYTGKQSYLIKPLFPRYIFAKFEAHDLRKVTFSRGVHSVVSFGGCPCPVADEIITIIQTKIVEDGYVTTSEKLGFGDQVTVKDGSFRDLIGMFEHDTKGIDRVMILLATVSYQLHVVIERRLVEKRATIKAPHGRDRHWHDPQITVHHSPNPGA